MQYSLKQAADELGVSYQAMWRAIKTKQVVPSAEAGRSRVLDENNIEALRQYFQTRPNAPMEVRI